MGSRFVAVDKAAGSFCIPSISEWVVADIVLINPRFELSFWGLEHCMRLFGKRANLPVACLALLAALVPDRHQVTLVDENVEDIDFERLGRADLVCLTGMSIQGRRLIEILEECRARGVMTVVGGPMATVEPEALEGFADVIFVGEADNTWPEFLREWEQGCHKTRYEQPEKTDLTLLPLPRVELLKSDRYMFGSLQISRGCPFTCEFCDIIVTFGRRPRLKTSEQVLAELEAFRRAGLDIIFVVDDNLIGNKKAIKPVLREIVRWQQERAYPLTLFTEASLDLAEDEELMELMGLANFQSVFIGIETPNEDSLRETKKHQNVRPSAGTLLERVHRVQQHGIDVWCGMIVGFDHDDVSIFDVMPKFLAEARISAALIGMLYAIPTTPLYDRLREAGRLNDAEASETYGTNVVPLGMSSEELRDGFVRVMQACYSSRPILPAPRRTVPRRELQVHPACAALLAEPPLGVAEAIRLELRQICGCCRAPAAAGRRCAAGEIPPTAPTHPARSLEGAPYPVHLCAEGELSLSLRGNRDGPAPSERGKRGYAHCGAIFLACEASD